MFVKRLPDKPRMALTGSRDRLIVDTADKVDKLAVRVRCLSFAVAVMGVYMLAMMAIGGWN